MTITISREKIKPKKYQFIQCITDYLIAIIPLFSKQLYQRFQVIKFHQNLAVVYTILTLLMNTKLCVKIYIHSDNYIYEIAVPDSKDERMRKVILVLF